MVPLADYVRSCDNFWWFQPHSAHCNVWEYKQIFKYTKSFSVSGDWLIILRFPEIVYSSSNWGGYLYGSYGLYSNHWWRFIVSSNRQSQTIYWLCHSQLHLTAALRIGDLPGLVLQGKQLWLERRLEALGWSSSSSLLQFYQSLQNYWLQKTLGSDRWGDFKWKIRHYSFAFWQPW